MSTKQITIQKVGSDTPVAKAPRKTIKTFPRGILKRTSKLTLKGVTDPAKSPVLRKGLKKHTLRLLTEKGMKKHRKTLKQRISNMSDSKVLEITRGTGLVVNRSTPPSISRQILDNAVSAGFVSV